MGWEWVDGPRSPMDTGDYSGGSGGSGGSGSANGKAVIFGAVAFIALPAGFVVGLALYFARGYGLI